MVGTKHARRLGGLLVSVTGLAILVGAVPAVMSRAGEARHRRQVDMDVDGGGRQTLESLWKRSPEGIMSDLVEEHHRPAGAATEPLTMRRRRTTLGGADQLQRPPTCRPTAVIDSWTDATPR